MAACLTEILAALRAHWRTSLEVSENGCWVLAELCVDDDGRRRVVAGGGCEGEFSCYACSVLDIELQFAE